MDLDIRIETLEPVDGVAVRRTGPYRESAPEAWAALWTWIGENGHGERVRRAIGYGIDDPAKTPASNLRYEACIDLGGNADGDDDAGIVRRRLAGGRHAIHTLRGPYRQIGEAFVQMHRQLAADAGTDVDYTRPFIELYDLHEPGTPEEQFVTHLCIPIGG